MVLMENLGNIFRFLLLEMIKSNIKIKMLISSFINKLNKIENFRTTSVQDKKL